MEVPQNGRFKMENPIKVDDLGVPPFQETSSWDVMFKSLFINTSFSCLSKKRWGEGTVIYSKHEVKTAILWQPQKISAILVSHEVFLYRQHQVPQYYY